jgi:hypothetical protein
MKHITRLTVTNSVNDNTDIEWGFFETESEQMIWRQDKETEQRDWNHNTPGAQSYRYYDFEEYTPEELLDMDMSQFEGLSLREFLLIVKTVS